MKMLLPLPARDWNLLRPPVVVEDIHLLKEFIANYYDDNDNGCHNDNDRAVFKWLSKNQNQSNYSDQSQQEQTAPWTNQNS